MAAGSVMNEPINGTTASTTQYMATPDGKGSAADRAPTRRALLCKMGRVAAITMMANTNSGSVKLRVSRYWMVCEEPTATNMNPASTAAQKPNTTSTSPSQCHRPACRGWVWARCSKNLVENVCTTASANNSAPTASIRVGARADSVIRPS